MRDDSQRILKSLRRERPPVHVVCGAVAAAFIADVLGAVGARPVLTHAPDEAGGLAAGSRALLVNLGQPDPLRREGALVAARAARGAGVPWLLDPVLAHASPRRMALTRELLALSPAIVKPNRDELRALAEGRDGEAGAGMLARGSGAVTLTTGRRDLASDGARVEQVGGGHRFMDDMSGFGCALGALAAAMLAVAAPFDAALAAAESFAEAGTRAAAGNGPGSFRVAFVDELYRLGEGS